MNETVSALMTGTVTAPVCHGEGLADVVGWIRVIPMIIICLVEGRERDSIKKKNKTESEKKDPLAHCVLLLPRLVPTPNTSANDCMMSRVA